MSAPPRVLGAELDALVAALVDAAPPLTQHQRDVIAAALRPAQQTPTPRGGSVVASARAAALGSSAGATNTPPDPCEAVSGAHDRHPRVLRRPGFRAIPRRPT